MVVERRFSYEKGTKEIVGVIATVISMVACLIIASEKGRSAVGRFFGVCSSDCSA